jgi:hypothetical protein
VTDGIGTNFRTLLSRGSLNAMSSRGLERRFDANFVLPGVGGKSFGSGVPTLRQNSVTVLLPFLAYFCAKGDESSRKRTKVSSTQVEEKARTFSVLLPL